MADPVDELKVLLDLDIGPLEDKVDDTIDEVERLDGKSTDNLQGEFGDAEEAADDLSESIDDADSKSLDVDVDSEEVSQLQRRLQALNGRSVEIDTHLDDAETKAALNALDSRTVDVDVETDREGSFGSSGRQDRIRLPGELDEVQEAARAFGRLSPQVKALSGAVVAATGALAASGGLAGAATALATRFGDLELRRDLQKLKQRFRKVGADFVEAFEPIIRDTVIPAAVTLAQNLRGSIPELKKFARDNLPSLIQAIEGLVQGVVFTVKSLGLFNSALGAAISAFQLISDSVDIFGEEGPQIKGVRKEAIDILQSFGFGGQQVGGFQVPKTQIASIVERIRSGDTPIGGEGGTPATEDLKKLQRQIRVAWEKFRRLESFTRKDLQKALVRLRKKGVESLLSLEDKTGENQRRTEDWIESLKKAQSQLQSIEAEESQQELLEATEQPADATTVEGAEPTRRAPIPPMEELLSGVSLEKFSGGLSALQEAAEGGAGSITEINSLIEATRQQFDTLNNDEAQAFVGRLQKMRSEMKENQTEAAAIGGALARSVARSADRLFQEFGQSISDAIFGGGGGPGKAQSKLQLFNAKKQMRSLKESLRQGQISYREFSLRMQAQQKKIQKRQEQVNDAMKSGFAQAAESMLGAFKQVAKQLIAEITAVIAKMLVLKAITTAFTISSGGFVGTVISNLGGSAFLEDAASGGMVKESGLAVIHEDEQIVNAETVGMMQDFMASVQSFTQPVMPNAQSAIASATGGQLKVQNDVQITGELRGRGPDLVASFRQALSEEATVGGPGSL
jgi:hypothetical protein